ncbi:MAG: hypothetical protein COV52_03460 [Gammaproteobacteria bacterium CG11_big_fil_rev_8_21_14_0_20_46_22]|nr:MAG: hypothetical protein COW05_09725 [Gammaproteobacteria bacterium CG12_big_fil_rev_8_21_14_0_65_46_12]PIR11531.1 MAG: hypothetical protein COV52_03460 [Gammaproteobacteria bacterium CG11_big_fil_rev_8_21_14_0_20_46_22]
MKSTRPQAKKVYLYGDDALMIECYKALSACGLTIESLVLASTTLIDWAESTGLSYTLDHEGAFNGIKKTALIINSCRSHPPLGDRSKALELCYFETETPCLYERSPIPLALLNDSEHYTICWGLVKSDTACLVEQAKLSLKAELSSGEVIEQCLLAASDLLPLIVEKLEDILKLSLNFLLLAKTHQSLPYTLINELNDQKLIARYIRALCFGNFDNPYQLPTLVINDEAYVCQDYKSLDQKPRSTPLRLIQINEESMTLDTQTGKMTLDRLQRIDEQPFSSKKLKRSIVLPHTLTTPTELHRLKATNLNETHLLHIFRSQLASPLPYFASRKRSGTPASQHHFSTPHESPSILAALAIYIAKLNNAENVLIGHHTEDLPDSLKKLASSCQPIHITIDKETSNASVREQAKQELNAKHQLLPHDFFLRHPTIPKENTRWISDNIVSFSQRKKAPEQPISDLAVHHNIENQQVTVFFQSALLNFDEQSAICRQIAAHLEHILNQIQGHPDLVIKHLSINTPEEHATIIAMSRGPQYTPSHERLIPFFEQCVKQWPDQPAIIDGDNTLSYKELDTLSSTLANHLKALMRDSETLVALYGDRCANIIIAILGILKAGKIYVPIDAKNPPARIQIILSSCNCTLVLYDGKAIEEQTKEIRQLNIHSLFTLREITEENSEIKGEDPACLLFTSGSTGKPKGVYIPRRAIVNHVEVYQRLFSPRPGSKISFISSIGFDGSIADLFPCLLSGAAVIVAPKGVEHDIETLTDWINDAGISHCFLSTALINLLLKQADKLEIKQAITLLSGGAALNPYKTQIHNVTLSNLYGPTEATGFVTQARIEASDDERRHPTIGVPVDNNDIYILTPDNKLSPIGAIGEIHITGLNLSLGYTDKALTEKKFVSISIDGETKKAYATGDLARYLPDGSLDFIGRKDTQNKINGYLVDTMEIKQTLLRHEGIAQVAVVVQGKQNKPVLIAYLVASKRHPLNLESIKDYMQEQLPSYMQPAFYLLLDRIPTNLNQKIDIAALEKTLSTRTETESRLIKQLETVIGVPLEHFIHRHTRLSSIGLNSLMRIELAFALETAFNVPVSIKVFYAYDSFESLAAYLDSAKKKTEPSRFNLPQKTSLSGPQILIANFIKLNPESPAYNIAISWRLNEKLDLTRLNQALAELIKQQPILTSRIDLNKNEIELTNQTITVKAKSFSDSDLLNQFKTKLQEEPFELAKKPAFRAVLIRHNDHDEFFIVVHHIIFDDWSLGIFCEQLSKLYNGESPSHAELNYLNFCEKTHETVDENKLSYWQQELKNIKPLSLPYDKVENELALHGKTLQHSIPAPLASHIKQTLSENNVTFFGALCAVFAFSLSIFSRSDDVYFLFPYINREDSGFEKIIGYFSNTLPLIFNLDPEKTLHELISTSLNRVHNAIEHAINFESINACLPKELRKDVHLASALINYQLEKSNRLALGKQLSEEPSIYYTGTKLDLSINVFERSGKLIVEAEFNTNRFSNNLIEKFVAFFAYQLENIAWQLDTPLKQLPLCPPELIESISGFEHDGELALGFNHCYDAFADIVKKYPNNTAIISDTQAVSYAILGDHVKCIYSTLSQPNMASSRATGLLITPGISLVATMLACLRLGRPYILLSLEETDAAISDLLSSMDASLLVCDNNTVLRAKGLSPNTLNIDETTQNHIIAEKTPSLDDLACFFYTSGTTGRRKIINISHANILTLAQSQIKTLCLDASDRVLSVSNVTFDAFHWEVFGAILSGASLVLFSEKILPGQMLNQKLRDYDITQIACTPALLTYSSPDSNIKLKRIIMGGETCPLNTAKRWRTATECLYVAYGPAEGSVAVTLGLYEANKPRSVGKTFGNAKVYLLDKHYRRLPPGFIGEIYIGGMNVCQGYHNQNQLNDSRFLKNPFGIGKLYKTGDLGRWFDDGDLEFLGREDYQVKLFGYRIELEAIARAFLDDEYIQQAYAAVISIEDSPCLCVYLVSQDTLQLDVLKETVKHKLPFYMLPHRLIQIEAIPLTQSGKVDIKALPLPKANDDHTLKVSSPTETALIALWQKLLPHATINHDTRFFEAGGHSILAAYLIDSLKNEFQLSISYADLIKHNSIEELAALIDGDAIQKDNELLHINAVHNGTPLILIHPMGGTIFWYLNTAKDINNPVFAIQDPSIERDCEFSSLQEMAKHYYDLIKTSLPKGPYILGGASSGSNIAAEISELMRQNHDEILAILSLDGWALYPKRFEEKQLVKAAVKAQVDKYTEQFKHYAIKDPARWLARQDARIELMLHYKPCEVHCPLYLFKAQDIGPLFEAIDASDNHWTQYCHKSVHIVTVSGDHESMHDQRHAASLAVAINTAIDVLSHPITS